MDGGEADRARWRESGWLDRANGPAEPLLSRSIASHASHSCHARVAEYSRPIITPVQTSYPLSALSLAHRSAALPAPSRSVSSRATKPARVAAPPAVAVHLSSTKLEHPFPNIPRKTITKVLFTTAQPTKKTKQRDERRGQGLWPRCEARPPRLSPASPCQERQANEEE